MHSQHSSAAARSRDRRSGPQHPSPATHRHVVWTLVIVAIVVLGALRRQAIQRVGKVLQRATARLELGTLGRPAGHEQASAPLLHPVRHLMPQAPAQAHQRHVGAGVLVNCETRAGVLRESCVMGG